MFFDQANALDTLKQKWVIRVLIQIGMPRGFISFILATIANVAAYVRCGPTTAFAFYVTAGLLQGDPLSAVLYVLCIEPLLLILRESVANCSIIRACADDIGLATSDIRVLRRIYKDFEDFRRIAGNRLKHRKCVIVALSAPLKQAILDIRAFLRNFVPEWASFEV